MREINWQNESVRFFLDKEVSPAGQVILNSTEFLSKIRTYTHATRVLCLRKKGHGSSYLSSCGGDDVIVNHLSVVELWQEKGIYILPARRLSALMDLDEHIDQWLLIPCYKNDPQLCVLLGYRAGIPESEEYLLHLEVIQTRLLEIAEWQGRQQLLDHLKIRFKGILQNVEVSLIFLAEDGQYCWLNKLAVSLLGVTGSSPGPEELCEAILQLKRDASNFEELESFPLSQLISAGKDVNWIYRNPDYRVLNVRCKQVQSEGQNGILWIFEDITQRVADQEKLQEQNLALEKSYEELALINERYSLAARATNDGIWDWDLLNNFLYWGEGYQRTFGFEASGTGEVWLQNIHPDDVEEVRRSIKGTIEDGHTLSWEAEYRYFNKVSQSYSFVIDRGYVIRNAEGVALRMVGSMQDITELKLKERKILKQNRRLREIARMNSHLIRKPIANILGLLNLIEEAERNEVDQLLPLLKDCSEELDGAIREVDLKARTSKGKV